MEAKLSQDEIDRLFREHGNVPDETSRSARSVSTYDFRRPDRIPKEQLRAIHLMHDFLARNLASSLGAYLRAYVTVSLVSVEQLSFGEFLQYLPTPTCLFSIGMDPMDGNAVLEMNPSLVFPMLNVLLGGSGSAPLQEVREATEIELSILEGVTRIVLHDLKEAWAPVAAIDFDIDESETQPQLVQILSPNEAIVAIGFEITMGENRGMMNFGIPSIIVKMMGQKFEQQWSIRRRGDGQSDQRRMRQVLRVIPLALDGLIEGARIGVGQVLELEPGDVISLDIAARRPISLVVGGKRKFAGEIVAVGNKRGIQITDKVASAHD